MAAMIVGIISPVIRDEIKTTVNGKIDKLRVRVEELHKKLKKQDETIAPAIETLSTIRSGRNFIVWAAPAVAAIGAVLVWIKNQ